jgi:hypothetical protein
MAEAFSVLQARCDPALFAQAERAAKARGVSHAEFIRYGVRTALELDGYDPAAVAASRDAGALYDSVEGLGRCYALISGDRIVTMAYHATEPSLEDYAPGRGDRVLPVKHEDSEPYRDDVHWRLPPVDRLEADRVVRAYQVVPKSW